MSHQPNLIYEFGFYRLDAAERLLLLNGEAIPLQPKAFDLLLALVEHPGRLLEKEELMKMVWPDALVEEANLANNISILRKALSENGQPLIQTAPKRGYRFVGEVHRTTAAPKPEPDLIAAVAPGDSATTTETAAARFRLKQPIQDAGRRFWRLTMVLILFLIGIAAGIDFWAKRQPTVSHAGEIKSLAVLPVRPLHKGEGDEYLGIGLADAIITRLSGTGKLIVRPTSAIVRYTARDMDPLAIGREQKADAVLESSLWRSGEKVRLNTRLLAVRDGRLLWSYSCEEFCTDLFAAQNLLSAEVVDALRLELTGAEREALTKWYTNNRAAFQLYLKGRFALHQRTGPALKESIDYFERAIALDQGFALAYAGRGYALMSTSHLRLAPATEMMPKAKVDLARALNLDPHLAEAHAYLGNYLASYEWKSHEAEREYLHALELNPNCAEAHNFYGSFLMQRGRFEEALTQVKAAEALDPISPFISRNIGMFLFFGGRYDEAIAQLQKVLKLHPTHYTAYQWLGYAYEQMGEQDKSIEAFLTYDQMRGVSPQPLAALRLAFATGGYRGYWKKWIDIYLEERKHRFVSPMDIVHCYARLGDRRQTLAWLEKALEERNFFLMFLRVSPLYKDLRGDPRFIEIARRVGLMSDGSR